jgi:hypothetical protein
MFESELAALEALYEAIVGLPGTIASAIIACIYLVLYPVVVLVNCVYAWIADAIGSYLAIINEIQTCAAELVGLVSGTFDGVVPSVWVALMLSTIALNVAIRIYMLLKGVSIFGWSL